MAGEKKSPREAINLVLNNNRPKLKKSREWGKYNHDLLGEAGAEQDRLNTPDVVGGRKNWQAEVLRTDAYDAPYGICSKEVEMKGNKIVSYKARVPLLHGWLPNIDSPQVTDCYPAYSGVMTDGEGQVGIGGVLAVEVPSITSQRYGGGRINATMPSSISGRAYDPSARHALCKDPARPDVAARAKRMVTDALNAIVSGARDLVSDRNPKKTGASFGTDTSGQKVNSETKEGGTPAKVPPTPEPAQSAPPKNIQCSVVYAVKSTVSGAKNKGRNTTSDTDPNGIYPAYPLPQESPLTSKFGMRIDPVTRATTRMHKGVDFGVKIGTPVLASLPGKVVAAQMDPPPGRGGYYIKIHHPEYGGYYTLYMHLDSLLVRAGDTVERGTHIGFSGNTGVGTGPHLHYESRTGPGKNHAIDPLGFLNTKLLRKK